MGTGDLHVNLYSFYFSVNFLFVGVHISLLQYCASLREKVLSKSIIEKLIRT